MKSAKASKKETRTIVMVRHANRYPITAISQGFGVGLTPEGERNAEQFGRELKQQVHQIAFFHSPAPRCKRTAEHMRNGFASVGGKARIIGDEERLAMPWIVDKTKLFNEADRLGDSAFIRSWFDGNLSKDLIRPAARAALESFAWLVEAASSTEETYQVHVTHDWNIVLLREFFAGVRHEVHGWPQFLDKNTITFANDLILFTCCDQTARHKMPRGILEQVRDQTERNWPQQGSRPGFCPDPENQGGCAYASPRQT